MLTHDDWDTGEKITQDTILPTNIKKLVISHDGGRLRIEVDGEELYYTSEGTRDCSIEITVKEGEQR